MGEPLGHPQLPPVLGRELDAYPAAEAGGPGADVGGDVEDCAGHNADELPLRPGLLIMEAPEHMPPARALVVLDKRHGPANGRREGGGVKALEKRSAVVGEHAGLEQEHAGNLGGYDVHPRRSSRASSMRYSP